MIGYVVHGCDRNAARHPVAGDHDLYDREMRATLVRQHQRGGDEGLVRFASGPPIRFTLADTPLWTDWPWAPPVGGTD